MLLLNPVMHVLAWKKDEDCACVHDLSRCVVQRLQTAAAVIRVAWERASEPRGRGEQGKGLVIIGVRQ